MNKLTPIFLLSLPRTGSTLLQGILARHSAIATTAEPWALLPLFYARRPGEVISSYDHEVLAIALDDLISTMPNGVEDYYDAVRAFANTLYKHASLNGEKYFLDKTPRYAAIAGELQRAFPEAPFIYLWRNPIAVISSIVQTFYRGRWKIYGSAVDLVQGQLQLIEAFKQNTSAISVKYEDLVVSPHEVVAGILMRLGLEDETPAQDSNLAPAVIAGKLGDPNRGRKYQSVSDGSLGSWQDVVCNPIRKWWIGKYIQTLGRDNLACMGYCQDELFELLEEAPMSLKYALSDVFDTVLGFFAVRFNLEGLRRKWRSPARHFEQR